MCRAGTTPMHLGFEMAHRQDQLEGAIPVSCHLLSYLCGFWRGRLAARALLQALRLGLAQRAFLGLRVPAPTPASSPLHRAHRQTDRTSQKMFPASLNNTCAGSKSVVEFLFQRCASRGDLGEELFVLGQEV